MQDKDEESVKEETTAEQESAQEKPEEEASDTESTAGKETEEKKDSKPEEPAAEEDKKEKEKEEQETSDEDKKSRFSRKKKDKKDQQIEDLTDRVQRQMAEFDNFRKRSEKEKSAMFDMGAKSILEKILPTVDNFERGLSGLSEEQMKDPFVQGMEKVYRQLVTALEGIGVKPIEAVGQPFDPNFHNAVQHVEDEEAGENIVVEEFQKGYMYHDSVLRHSMVKVAN